MSERFLNSTPPVGYARMVQAELETGYLRNLCVELNRSLAAAARNGVIVKLHIYEEHLIGRPAPILVVTPECSLALGGK